MLKIGTLLRVDEQFMAGMSYALRIMNEAKFDLRTRIQRNSMLEADSGTEVYSGFFAVSLLPAENSGENPSVLQIINGFDPSNDYAGYVYYNLKRVACQRSTISASEGYLCVGIDTQMAVTYSIEPIIPDMPIVTNDNQAIAKYPLAYIMNVEENVWGIQQISRYEIPHTFCWGVCDTETTEEAQ